MAGKELEMLKQPYDRIRIQDLEIFARHGVYPEENALGQKFVVSADLYLSTRKAGRRDALSLSIDYGGICKKIKAFLEEHTFRLLEAVAEGLAQELLLETPLLEKIVLEIKKPWAPVRLPLDTVSVRIERGWHEAYLGLGSNLGDRKAYLDQAVEFLSETKGCTVLETSDYLETKPYGGVQQDDFLNAVLHLKTLLFPHELLDLLHEAENRAHRERTVRWGPRTLDLDILFYDDLVLDDADLHIPHIDLQNRDFVLIPLAQIAPWLRHPLSGKTVEQMYQELGNPSRS